MSKSSKTDTQKIITGAKNLEVLYINEYTDVALLLKAVKAALGNAKAIVIVK